MTPCWIRVAGNAAKIRENTDAYHWRAFLSADGPEIPLVGLTLSGMVSPVTFCTGTDPLRENTLGLVAWFDCYGTLTVDASGMGHIVCASPPSRDSHFPSS